VARSIHVRLDDASSLALDVVRATEGSDSDAVRAALREAAARRRASSTVAAEAFALSQNIEDRDEMRVIREQMADLAPPLEG
jgi:hypothetical protein